MERNALSNVKVASNWLDLLTLNVSLIGKLSGLLMNGQYAKVRKKLKICFTISSLFLPSSDLP
jgi:hypothetical protein